jgi:predicted ATPase with chaperone activity
MTTLTIPVSAAKPAPALPDDFKPEPLSVAALGLDRGVLRDLTLKTMYYRGRMTRAELGAELRVSQPVMEEVLGALSLEGMVQILGAEGSGSAAYTYALAQKGVEHAESAIARGSYVGPAPVPLAEYVATARAQTVVDAEVTRDEVLHALGDLVLADETVLRIGRAASSRKPTLVYGASGNGKTTAVRALGTVVGGTILVPYAIEVVGQIIHLYDPSKHVRVEDDDVDHGDVLRARADRRWVRIKRPVIWAGGELTRHSLELVYDDQTKVYEAPLQLKANGGTLIIDDFGRQQMPAVQLLNRWIVALEGGLDHLTMHTGQTIEVPFDVLVLFSTNLPPERLADEAFLRRIRYKVEVPNPTADEYREIVQRECAKSGIAYDAAAVDHLLATWYDAHRREIRGCHPRDIVEAIVDAASYEGRGAQLTPALVDEACSTYFLRPMNAPD